MNCSGLSITSSSVVGRTTALSLASTLVGSGVRIVSRGTTPSAPSPAIEVDPPQRVLDGLVAALDRQHDPVVRQQARRQGQPERAARVGHRLGVRPRQDQVEPGAARGGRRGGLERPDPDAGGRRTVGVQHPPGDRAGQAGGDQGLELGEVAGDEVDGVEDPGDGLGARLEQLLDLLGADLDVEADLLQVEGLDRRPDLAVEQRRLPHVSLEGAAGDPELRAHVVRHIAQPHLDLLVLGCHDATCFLSVPLVKREQST